MSDPRSITADAFEILVARELRKAGLEPIKLHRRAGSLTPGNSGFVFDLVGRLESYGHRWLVLIECRNRPDNVRAADVAEVRRRAVEAKAASALLFATTEFNDDALQAASESRVALLRVVDAHTALSAAGVIDVAQMPAWMPDFTVQLVWREDGPAETVLLQANEPEPLLRRLRPRG